MTVVSHIHSESKIIECPITDDFVFTNHCVIKTCKYYTRTVLNRCLLISGRVDPAFVDDGRISDENLVRWKGDVISELTNNPDYNIKEIRKEAVNRVNAIIILDRYLRFLEDNRNTPNLKKVKSRKLIAMSYKLLCDRIPFNEPLLNFTDWQAPYLFIEDTYRNFQNQVEQRTSVPKFSPCASRPSTVEASVSSKQPTKKRPKVFRTKTSETDISAICFLSRTEWEDCRNKLFVARSSLFSG